MLMVNFDFGFCVVRRTHSPFLCGSTDTQVIQLLCGSTDTGGAFCVSHTLRYSPDMSSMSKCRRNIYTYPPCIFPISHDPHPECSRRTSKFERDAISIMMHTLVVPSIIISTSCYSLYFCDPVGPLTSKHTTANKTL